MTREEIKRTAPQTPLSERLYGKAPKVYDHWIICSGSRYKPIGHPGCICRIDAATKDGAK